MGFTDFLNSDLFAWVVLPLLIFLARICDVTIGTIRLIFLARGYKFIAPVLGFFEVLIWLLAIRQVMQNLSNPVCYIAYASGFATGNWIGMYIDEKIAMGKLIVRLITPKDTRELTRALSKRGFGVTKIPGEGSQGEVSIIFMIIDRVNLPIVLRIINRYTPKAFYTIEDVRTVREGIFPRKINIMKKFLVPANRRRRRFFLYSKFHPHRKGK